VQALEQLVRACGVARRQQQAELLAAPARQHVGVAQVLAPEVPGQPQQAIAALVAVLVVVGLEEVEIEHDDRQRQAGPPRDAHLAIEQLLPRPPVGQSGQLVGARQLGQPVEQRAALHCQRGLGGEHVEHRLGIGRHLGDRRRPQQDEHRAHAAGVADRAEVHREAERPIAEVVVDDALVDVRAALALGDEQRPAGAPHDARAVLALVVADRHRGRRPPAHERVVQHALGVGLPQRRALSAGDLHRELADRAARVGRVAVADRAGHRGDRAELVRASAHGLLVRAAPGDVANGVDEGGASVAQPRRRCGDRRGEPHAVAAHQRELELAAARGHDPAPEVLDLVVVLGRPEGVGRPRADELRLGHAEHLAERGVDGDDLAVARQGEALAHRAEDRLGALAARPQALDEAQHRYAEHDADHGGQDRDAPAGGRVLRRSDHELRHREDERSAYDRRDQLDFAAAKRGPDDRQQHERAEAARGGGVAQQGDRRQVQRDAAQRHGRVAVAQTAVEHQSENHQQLECHACGHLGDPHVARQGDQRREHGQERHIERDGSAGGMGRRRHGNGLLRPEYSAFRRFGLRLSASRIP
jgi:hypothetical protein